MTEQERKLNTGTMPDTDFRFEEFEGFLGSYYLALKPLNDGSKEDQADFHTATEALNQLAKSQGVQLPEASTKKPRPTLAEWGQPQAFKTPSALLDSFRSFFSDFGVGTKPNTPEFEQRLKLGRTVLSVLDRHGAIKAKFEETEGNKYPVGVQSQNFEIIFNPLQEVLKPK